MTDATAAQDRQSAPDPENATTGSTTAAESVAARRGRRIGAVIAWGLFGYLAAVGFASIPKQIFWPKAAAWPAGTTCQSGLDALTARLADVSSTHVRALAENPRAAAKEPPMPLRPFFQRWDMDHAGLESLCVDKKQRRAFTKLAIFRYRLATDLTRMERDESPILRSVEANLGSP